MIALPTFHSLNIFDVSEGSNSERLAWEAVASIVTDHEPLRHLHLREVSWPSDDHDNARMALLSAVHHWLQIPDRAETLRLQRCSHGSLLASIAQAPSLRRAWGVVTGQIRWTVGDVRGHTTERKCPSRSRSIRF